MFDAHKLSVVIVCVGLLGACALPAMAEGYKYRDPKTGRLVITDKPPQGDSDATNLGGSSPQGSGERSSPAMQNPPSRETLPRQSGYSPQEWGKICKSVGEMAAAMAQARDRGVPLSTAMSVGENTARALGPTPERLMRLILLQIYDNRWWTPAVAQQKIEVQCFKGGEGL